MSDKITELLEEVKNDICTKCLEEFRLPKKTPCGTNPLGGSKKRENNCITIMHISACQALAKTEIPRWIPVSERLPALKDRTGFSKRVDDGTVDVLGCDHDIIFTTNYYPKMGVWNGIEPKIWMKLPTLPQKAGEQE